LNTDASTDASTFFVCYVGLSPANLRKLRANILFFLIAAFSAGLLNILEQTGWVARGVLALLLFFSVVSWGMILQKLSLFGRIRRQSDQFLRIFRATRGIANPQALASAGSPFANVYVAGYRELQSQVGTCAGQSASADAEESERGHRYMQLASAEELRRVERGMTWLATTGSVTPFIGLFGTVWGIIDAFRDLAPRARPACAPSRREFQRPW